MLEKYDSEKMFEIYDNWPYIARDSYNSDVISIDSGFVDHIVFAGMGGSGAIGDLFSSILSNTKIHVTVVKGYLLPKTVDEKTLVVTTSVSGNTVETLTILKTAEKLDCKLLAFTSGGLIEEFCLKNKIPFRKISQFHSPRASFIVFVYSILKVLKSIISIENCDIEESLNELKKLSQKINSSNLTDSNPALQLADRISNVPVIYYPWGLQSAAIRFKSSLQENSKFHAITEDVIEACHNGIVAWQNNSSLKPILLEGKDDYIKTKERWKILKIFFKENEIEFTEVFSISGNILSKLVCLIYLLDYTTIYRAVMSQIDPSPVKPIDFIKNKLNLNEI
jgi:glucose/mannose-6-phosphate isomerase